MPTRKCDYCFSSFVCRTHASEELDVWFSVVRTELQSDRDVRVDLYLGSAIRLQRMACKIFTDMQIRRVPDCAVRLASGVYIFREHYLLPELHCPMQINWMCCGGSISSASGVRLDDERFCLVCGKIITGQQIQIAR